jgi:hypothetical protein
VVWLNTAPAVIPETQRLATAPELVAVAKTGLAVRVASLVLIFWTSLHFALVPVRAAANTYK